MIHVWRFLLHRSVLVTTLIVLAVLLFSVWSHHRGAQKLTDAELATDTGRLHLEFVLRFEPEAFHITLFQDAGRLINVEDRAVFLMDVPVETARELARR